MSNFERWYLIWSAITAIATVATAIIVCVAAVLALKQVGEASRARQLESALAVLSHINDPELRNARKLLYSHPEAIAKKVASNPSLDEIDSFFKEISKDKVDLDCFYSYLASLENVSILVLHDLAPDDIIEMYFTRMAPKHWERLLPFISFMRGVYGSDDYLQHFELMNILLKQGGLNIQNNSRMNLIPLSKSERMKRELLNQRRQARDAGA